MSSFSYGYGIAKKSSRPATMPGSTCAAHAASLARPASAAMRIGAPPRVTPASTSSNGPIANATR